MSIKNFSTVGYFAEVYFNCSMDLSDLESLIEDFLMREDTETIEAFKNEVEVLHMYALEGTMPVKDIASILIHRGISSNKIAEDVIKIFYDKKIKKIKFRDIYYFFNCFFGVHDIGLFDFESRIDDFLMWENSNVLEKEIDTLYKLNDSELIREADYLKNRIEDFFRMVSEERVKAFRKEIQAVYTLINNPKLMKVVASRLGGDIRMPTMKAVSVIKLLDDKCIKRAK